MAQLVDGSQSSVDMVYPSHVVVTYVGGTAAAIGARTQYPLLRRVPTNESPLDAPNHPESRVGCEERHAAPHVDTARKSILRPTVKSAPRLHMHSTFTHTQRTRTHARTHTHTPTHPSTTHAHTHTRIPVQVDLRTSIVAHADGRHVEVNLSTVSENPMDSNLIVKRRPLHENLHANAKKRVYRVNGWTHCT